MLVLLLQLCVGVVTSCCCAPEIVLFLHKPGTESIVVILHEHLAILIHQRYSKVLFINLAIAFEVLVM